MYTASSLLRRESDLAPLKSIDGSFEINKKQGGGKQETISAAEEHGAPFTIAPTVSEHPTTQLFSEHSAGMSTSLKLVLHFAKPIRLKISVKQLGDGQF